MVISIRFFLRKMEIKEYFSYTVNEIRIVNLYYHLFKLWIIFINSFKKAYNLCLYYKCTENILSIILLEFSMNHFLL